MPRFVGAGVDAATHSNGSLQIVVLHFPDDVPSIVPGR